MADEWVTGKPRQSGWYWVKVTTSTCEVGYFNNVWGLKVNDRAGYVPWKKDWMYSGPLFPPPFPPIRQADILSMETEDNDGR